MYPPSFFLAFLSVVLLLTCLVILIRSKLMLLDKGFPVGWSFRMTDDYLNLIKANKSELNPMEKKRVGIQKNLMLSLRWIGLTAFTLLALAFYLA